MGENMYWILHILFENQNKSMSINQLREELSHMGYEAGVRNIRTCIKNINAFCYEWFMDDKIAMSPKSGLSVKNHFFSDGELQFLLDSIIFHQDLKNEDKDKLSYKLLSLSTYSQKQRLVMFSPLEHQLSFSLFVNLSTIMKAIENQTAIQYEYVNYGVVEEHLQEIPSTNGNDGVLYWLSPYQIVNQNNHYYVIGYNQKYPSQLTTYRIDRMRKIQTTRHSFIDIREQFNMSDEIAKMTNMFNSSQRDTIQIECQQRILREIVSRFGKEIKVKKLYSDYYLVTIEDIPISEGLVGWIMMLHNQVKIVSPLYLKEEIKHRLQQTIALYE